MTKNTKGGKGKKKGKRQNVDAKRELEFKEDEQDYAQITKMLGEGRLQADCFDGSTRICHIRGKFRKRVWMNVGDIILLGLRGFQDEKADVILKYTPDEARLLKAYGEIPESVVIGGAAIDDNGNNENEEVAFGDDSNSGENSPAMRTVSVDLEEKEEESNIDWNARLADL